MLKQSKLASITAQAPSRSGFTAQWMDQGACVPWDFTKDGDPFYPDGSAEHLSREGMSICVDCPVRAQCQEWAMGNKDSRAYGIFGGTSAEQRKYLHRKNQRNARNKQKPVAAVEQRKAS